jgi:hypothetical protein
MDKPEIKADSSLIVGTSTPIRIDLPQSELARTYRVTVSNEQDDVLQDREFTLHPGVDAFLYHVSAPVDESGKKLNVRLFDGADAASVLAHTSLDIER